MEKFQPFNPTVYYANNAKKKILYITNYRYCEENLLFYINMVAYLESGNIDNSLIETFTLVLIIETTLHKEVLYISKINVSISIHNIHKRKINVDICMLLIFYLYPNKIS